MQNNHPDKDLRPTGPLSREDSSKGAMPHPSFKMNGENADGAEGPVQITGHAMHAGGEPGRFCMEGASSEQNACGRDPADDRGDYSCKNNNVSNETVHKSSPADDRHACPCRNQGAVDDVICEQNPAFNDGIGARKDPDGGTAGGPYTLEDYLALPDERRVELIDGVFYDMAAPSRTHQLLVLEIWLALKSCIKKKNAPCEALAAPFDVNLDRYTVVQPDVMVFCGKDPAGREIRAPYAPDLVIEVLSPSTASRDRLLKLRKYRESGVREAWLVSPGKRQIEVYLFSEGEDAPRRYSFSDKVPVHISEDHPGAKCEVDFALICRDIGIL